MSIPRVRWNKNGPKPKHGGRIWRIAIGLVAVCGPRGAYSQESFVPFLPGQPSEMKVLALRQLWQTHPGWVVLIAGAITLQGILISWLMILRSRQRRSEQSLRVSEARYRGMVESQQEMVCRYLPDTTLTFVNEAYCRHFGKTRQELLGKTFLHLIPASALDEVKNTVAKLLRNRERVAAEHEVLLSNGQIGWQRWEDFVILGANGEVEECQGIGHDITEQKRAEERLRINEKRMLLAAEAANLSFWAWDVSKDDVWMTSHRSELLGLQNAARVTYADFLARVHPDDREMVRAAIHRAMDGEGQFENEYRVLLPSGETRWFISRGGCVTDRTGAVAQMVGVSMDVTTQRRANEAMHNLVHATRLALVGELTASIAHEMNQPLGAILSNADAAELLMDADHPALDQIREILSDIRKDDLRASEVIRHLRAFLRKQEMQMLPTDVNQLVGEAVRMAAGEARRRHITLERTLCAEGTEIQGDAVHLQQVLLNLILNGMDAMDTTPLPQKRLMVSTQRVNGAQVEVSVIDAGHGIGEDQLEKIFESFFTTKEDGMGLGLAISRSIIERHQGQIRAANNAGQSGATFSFTLPATK